MTWMINAGRHLSGILVLTVCAWMLAGNAQAVETVTYYHTDALGTPVMESNAGGAITYLREHRPYGEQVLAVSAPKNGPGFTGHVGDADTGLTYMQARYYDPMAGRFITRDPTMVSFTTGANFNRYWYGNNNPFRFTDPNGMLACSESCLKLRAASDRVGGGISGFTSNQLQLFVSALNRISAQIAHNSERAAVYFFAINAIALQKKTGHEIGANLEERSETDFRVIDFHSDDGERARTEVETWSYAGSFTWKGILHTHPENVSFSGLGVYGQDAGYHELYVSSDAQQAVQKETNVYVARPNMSIQKLNYDNWDKAVKDDNTGRKIYAQSYVEGM